MYREVLELAPEDAQIALPASRSLERLYAAAGKSKELADILRVEVKLEDDREARRELSFPAASVSSARPSWPGDLPGAIAAWRARLEDDAEDDRALVALDRLYERTGEHRALVEIRRSRERKADDKAARKVLLTRIATTLADKLTDVSEAILAYRVIVDDFGAEKETLSALETLYEIADRWQDLEAALDTHLGLAEAHEERLALLSRLGHVRLAKLADVPQAIDAYRQALMLDPSHAVSRTALEGLLLDTNARRDAAGILRPLYEADGEQDRLLRVLDIEAEYADTPPAKLATIFAQAASVAEGPLDDAGRAFDYAAKGLREGSGGAGVSALAGARRTRSRRGDGKVRRARRPLARRCPRTSSTATSSSTLRSRSRILRGRGSRRTLARPATSSSPRRTT